MDKYYIKTEDWERIYAFLKARNDTRVKNERETRVCAEAVYLGSVQRTVSKLPIKAQIELPFKIYMELRNGQCPILHNSRSKNVNASNFEKV